MRIRIFLATALAVLLAAPTTASAEGLLGTFKDIFEGSQRPVPGGRGEIAFKNALNPCGTNQLTNRQSGYFGRTLARETWGQIGRQPKLLPPGTFWELGDQEGFIPTDLNATEPIPASIKRVPAGAARITTNNWTTAPGGGKLVPYQPKTTLACSVVYRMKYSGPWSPFGSQGAQATAICPDANDSTPYVQWIQNLGKDTPALFKGIEDDKALIQALRGAVEGGFGKSAKTVMMNTFKELWGGKPKDILGIGLVEKLLGAAVNGYLKEVAKQSDPLSNAVWDYYLDTGGHWAHWAPANSTFDGEKLEIGVISADPSADWLTISVACTSTPTMQGNVLDMRDRGGVRSMDQAVYQPTYYGTALNSTAVIRGRAARASAAPDDERVATTGADEIFGSEQDHTLRGGKGDDKLIGGPGSDELLGGTGEDLLVDNSAGPNVLVGGDGIDRFDARNGDGEADSITCGQGEDIVLADPGDEVAADCEHVFFSLDEAPHELDDALDQPRNWPRPLG